MSEKNTNKIYVTQIYVTCGVSQKQNVKPGRRYFFLFGTIITVLWYRVQENKKKKVTKHKKRGTKTKIFGLTQKNKSNFLFLIYSKTIFCCDNKNSSNGFKFEDDWMLYHFVRLVYFKNNIYLKSCGKGNFLRFLIKIQENSEFIYASLHTFV